MITRVETTSTQQSKYTQMSHKSASRLVLSSSYRQINVTYDAPLKNVYYCLTKLRCFLPLTLKKPPFEIWEHFKLLSMLKESKRLKKDNKFVNRSAIFRCIYSFWQEKSSALNERNRFSTNYFVFYHPCIIIIG